MVALEIVLDHRSTATSLTGNVSFIMIYHDMSWQIMKWLDLIQRGFVIIDTWLSTESQLSNPKNQEIL